MCCYFCCLPHSHPNPQCLSCASTSPTLRHCHCWRLLQFKAFAQPFTLSSRQESQQTCSPIIAHIGGAPRRNTHHHVLVAIDQGASTLPCTGEAVITSEEVLHPITEVDPLGGAVRAVGYISWVILGPGHRGLVPCHIVPACTDIERPCSAVLERTPHSVPPCGGSVKLDHTNIEIGAARGGSISGVVLGAVGNP
jgi:hypothetical protein